MKQPLKVLLLFAVALSFLVPRGNVSAGDYVSDAIEALKTSNVYVAPGATGTEYDTQSQLGKFLTPGDNIVLVMLPPEALAGTDLYTIARSISEGLGNQKTVGLAVGREVIGYSVLLPEGVAWDKMQRASSVSNDPVTALITFTQNVHSWLSENPLPTPTPVPTAVPTPRPPVELPKAEDISWPVWLVMAVFVLGTVIWLSVYVKKNAKRVLRRQSFAPLTSKIDVISEKIHDIADGKVRKELQRAIQLAYELVDILANSQTHLGYAEEKFPVLLANMDRQIMALKKHESGRRHMSADLLSDVKGVLLTYDDLFIALQKNDPDAVELLTSVYDSSNTMVSTLGYLDDDK
ncbi:hypothetical protein A3K29_05705 [Candidatus Collierbacteria bacterium RIFOXYB2_FULL_46_14]|uniref:TPM domain-containing protein n=1 Tax=Candidatus Collierbacteria bacterium GW2011_GWA2_46_26 TaxID=1618381 RepID=A0A0G1PII1_9BACT|nr:MAG: hypothetical protein UX47_C0009G0018 [Candidatus Collierbacteria bacterium GW2011_GWA2_46_26]OGD73584.1 MAG: hypothetical protein A3K29_05705 [Candidatus Collierbacteria bacterium RIFOXYB2_FULL_46_14]OGD76626.1 MAG: hypothetical protein A3K43_05705 [Candidatus Collierbacteria bacterium RIFOXYA2_FULL_46_20]OGD77962.1 MAG: hypothetical protein A3K39_05705 [Candidatus Collierbacteria bacterium RIFOXYC2_FULL_43_15]OGD79986.1 MAG: hypothetical protein A2320_00135 [Pseudomonadales bacterium G